MNSTPVHCPHKSSNFKADGISYHFHTKFDFLLYLIVRSQGCGMEVLACVFVLCAGGETDRQEENIEQNRLGLKAVGCKTSLIK